MSKMNATKDMFVEDVAVLNIYAAQAVVHIHVMWHNI
jgi:hypothetical protein